MPEVVSALSFVIRLVDIVVRAGRVGADTLSLEPIWRIDFALASADLNSARQQPLRAAGGPGAVSLKPLQRSGRA